MLGLLRIQQRVRSERPRTGLLGNKLGSRIVISANESAGLGRAGENK